MEALAQLKQYYEQGFMTKEDYDKKRMEIIEKVTKGGAVRPSAPHRNLIPLALCCYDHFRVRSHALTQFPVFRSLLRPPAALPPRLPPPSPDRAPPPPLALCRPTRSRPTRSRLRKAFSSL